MPHQEFGRCTSSSAATAVASPRRRDAPSGGTATPAARPACIGSIPATTSRLETPRSNASSGFKPWGNASRFVRALRFRSWGNASCISSWLYMVPLRSATANSVEANSVTSNSVAANSVAPQRESHRFSRDAISPPATSYSRRKTTDDRNTIQSTSGRRTNAPPLNFGVFLKWLQSSTATTTTTTHTETNRRSANIPPPPPPPPPPPTAKPQDAKSPARI